MTMTLVKNLTAGLALAVAIANGSGSAIAQKKAVSSQITTFDPRGSGTAAGQGTFAQQGLNSGTIVGYYIDADAVAHGFIRTINGKYTIIDVPEPRVHKLTASMRKGQWLGGGLRRLPRMAACITAICAIRTAT